MPESLLRSKRTVAVAVVATLVSVSAAVLLTGQSTTAHAAAAPGSTVRASVVNGTNAESPRGGANSELSADGTTVVFTSYSQLDDLKTGDYENVYVRDLRNNKTVLISRGQFIRPAPPEPEPIGLAAKPVLSLNGAQPAPPEMVETTANGSSRQPTISENGRFIAFVTQADNIVLNDDDTDQDLIVADRDPNGDGVFDEPREGGGLDIRYFRVSQPQYRNGDGYVYRVDYPRYPKLSDDASRIVWEDTFYDAEANKNFTVVRTAALRSMSGGKMSSAAAAPGTNTPIVNTTLNGNTPTAQYYPDVSSDGRFIVLVADYVRREGPVEFPDLIPFHAVIRKDTLTDAVLRVDFDESTLPDKPVFLSSDESVFLSAPAISSDGLEIAFQAEEFENGCSEGSCWYSVAQQPMVYVVRVDGDAKPVDSIVASRDNDGEVVNGFSPALSGDGRFLAFGTDNLNAHDGIDRPVGYTESCLTHSEDLVGKPMVSLSGLPPTSEGRNERAVCQVVVRDLVVDRERVTQEAPRLPGTLASAGTGNDCAETVPEGATCGGNDDSPPDTLAVPSLSRNGSTVAFDSRATNLVPDQADDNGYTDVFVRTFQPQLTADPNPLDFGELTLGDTFDLVVRLDHVGLGPLVVTDIAVEDSDEFSVGAQTCSGEAIILQQTSNCEVSVTFAPTEAGDRKGTLRVTLRDGRQFTIPLLGKGVEEPVPPDGPRFAAGPDPLNFGDRLLLSDGPTQAVTVTNVGDTPLKVGSVTVLSGVAPTDYTFAADTCTGASVPAKGTCQVTVRFSPAAPGDRPAVLRFVDDAPGGAAHLIGLAGKGSTPTLTLSPAVTQPGRVVTVTGQGYAPNKPVTITLTGSVESATVIPDATGTFTKDMLVLPKSPIGNRPVVGTIDGTGLKAERPLLIVTPSVTPSDFVVRS